MATRTSEIDLEALQADILQLKRDIATLRDSLASYGSEKVTELRTAADQRIESLRDELDRLTDDVTRQGRQTVAAAEEAVRDNPLTSLAVAFSAGLITSFILGRR